MAKNSIADWSTTAADNTDVGGISIAGTAPPSNLDNGVREIMAQVAAYIGADTELSKVHVKGDDIAAAATTDIGSATGDYVTITGTTTITALGTAEAGVERTVRFSGALTLTHNATSLILPGGANIATAAGDVATFVSEGAGNWRCMDYQRAAGVPPSVSAYVAPLLTQNSAVALFVAQGGARLLAPSGYIVFPFGLVIQWGTVSVTGGGVTLSYPMAFPSVCAAIVGNAVSAADHNIVFDNIGAANCTVRSFNQGGIATGVASRWFAVGY